jgi:hypothetical protein
MFCAHVNACEHSVRATPDSWVAGQPDRVDGHTIDAIVSGFDGAVRSFVDV